MSEKQHVALRLAEWLEQRGWPEMDEAAAELRRLHAENQILLDLCNRSLRALSEDDFPILREELRHFTKKEDHYV